MLLDKNQKDEYAEANYSLVFYVVKMFQSSGVPYDELVSIALVGYAKALNSFDTSRQVKFSTYAINCIQNEILFFLRKEKNHMRNNVSLGTILFSDKDGNNLSLEDTIGATGDMMASSTTPQNSLEDALLHEEDVDLLNAIITELSEKERYIITHRFGLYGNEIQTQKDIAIKIGMSQANISKLEQGIVVKIRTHFNEHRK